MEPRAIIMVENTGGGAYGIYYRDTGTLPTVLGHEIVACMTVGLPTDEVLERIGAKSLHMSVAGLRDAFSRCQKNRGLGWLYLIRYPDTGEKRSLDIFATISPALQGKDLALKLFHGTKALIDEKGIPSMELPQIVGQKVYEAFCIFREEDRDMEEDSDTGPLWDVSELVEQIEERKRKEEESE